MDQAVLDLRPADLPTARAVGERAAHLATDRAERDTPDFSARAMAAILKRLVDGPASGEDLTDYVRACGVEFKDGRALGGVIGGMSRRKQIRVVGNCHRLKGHGTAGGLIWERC
ncbi:MAG: hypothetical protein EOP39_04320 [Rubrivivax sp.]|nr:MAG: hypothetical protein EOP39_04320 [Rubrivivax sp.]